ncbi:hypothetical protein F0562_011432 [Nyssa sinensis]|uniref:FBD domain-containing protein n=1 Tax=Nyssa sinensis TaxID=561372 RepID=A0A5J5A3C5_9ASTE|nr:hypothetical protein F0562_011432 [Nyssa sinensis]
MDSQPEPVNYICGGKDRFSNMSDDILGQILSSIPTHLAVQTSVLSKRWRDVWTRAANIHLDDRLSFFSTKPKPTFESSADQILCRNQMPLRKFSLHCFRFRDVSRINAWIECALERKVTELDLFLADPYSQLTQRIYTCENLEVLRMYSDFDLHIPRNSVGFPRVKTLHLSVANPNSFLMRKLFRKFPVLEELQIDGVTCKERRSFKIFVPTLKRLAIRIANRNNGTDYSCYDFYVIAPALEYIDISDDTISLYHMEEKSLQSLIKAQVDVGAGIDFTNNDCWHGAYNRAMGLLSEVVNTKFLSLSASTIQVLNTGWYQTKQLPKFPKLVPTLPNLTSLELHVFDGFDWESVVLDYLKKAPKLEAFVLNILKGPKIDCWESSGQQRFAPVDCLLPQLKVIEIRGLKGRKNEQVFLKYLLKNAKFLEKMIINAASPSPKPSPVNPNLKRALAFLALCLSLSLSLSLCHQRPIFIILVDRQWILNQNQSEPVELFSTKLAEEDNWRPSIQEWTTYHQKRWV